MEKTSKIQNKNLDIRTVTVVGATGMMGRNISTFFASQGRAKVFMISRNREKSDDAISKIYHSQYADSLKNELIAADYSMLEDCVAKSDLVFESSAENWDVKSSVTSKIADAAGQQIENCKNTIFCTGSSGLSITDLANLFPMQLRGNYMGMHIFNPPWEMTLCEMTPTEWSKRDLFEAAMGYCRNVLSRTVVEVRDVPGFLANRIGFQFINSALQCADRNKAKGGIDYIDAILGPFTGRKMAPLVTSNFVGLDVHKAIVDNIYENTSDFAHEDFLFPSIGEKLIKEGKLGRRSGGGLYKTFICDNGEKVRLVYDIETGTYRPVIKYDFDFVKNMINLYKDGNFDIAFQLLTETGSPEAEICCSFLLKYVLYALEIAKLDGYDMYSVDDVMAKGFGWCPPLAMIQALGGRDKFSDLCNERIDSDILNQLDISCLLKQVKPSKYDYRNFLYPHS